MAMTDGDGFRDVGTGRVSCAGLIRAPLGSGACDRPAAGRCRCCCWWSCCWCGGGTAGWGGNACCTATEAAAAAAAAAAAELAGGAVAAGCGARWWGGGGGGSKCETALNSAVTLMPFSMRIRSSREVLERSMRTSSAALRDDCWRPDSCSSWCLMVASRCLMYSVRRSRKAKIREISMCQQMCQVNLCARQFP